MDGKGRALRVRGEVYRLLAGCFCLPEREVLLEERVPQRLADALDEIHPPAAPSARRMAGALAVTDALELRVEYARLFVGPQELLAPPYGSVYLDPGRQLMGESTAAVGFWYADEGLTLDPEAYEVPDHIAAELEFLYYLSWKEADARERAPGEADELAAKRDRFLEEQPAAWVGPFCDLIRRSTAHGFFLALADCLEAVLRQGR